MELLTLVYVDTLARTYLSYGVFDWTSQSIIVTLVMKLILVNHVSSDNTDLLLNFLLAFNKLLFSLFNNPLQKHDFFSQNHSLLLLLCFLHNILILQIF